MNGLKRFLALCLVLLLLTGSVGAADLSFTPSTYNEWGEPVIGASGYQPGGNDRQGILWEPDRGRLQAVMAGFP